MTKKRRHPFEGVRVLVDVDGSPTKVWLQIILRAGDRATLLSGRYSGRDAVVLARNRAGIEMEIPSAPTQQCVSEMASVLVCGRKQGSKLAGPMVELGVRHCIFKFIFRRVTLQVLVLVCTQNSAYHPISRIYTPLSPL